MVGRAVHQQWFQRCEKIALGISQAGMALATTAKFRAQIFHDGRGAGYLCAAQFEPLKLVQEIAAYRRCQPLQKFLDSVGLFHCGLISHVNEAFTMSPSPAEGGAMKSIRPDRRK